MDSTQRSVSFKDFNMVYTCEEWQHLGPVQCLLDRDMKLENYSNLISVGFHISKPDMILKLEQEEARALDNGRITKSEPGR